MRRIVTAVLLACSPITSCRDAPPPSNPSGGETTGPRATSELTANAVSDDVIDGDTLDVVVDGRQERVRLIGIDTPEDTTTTECFGPEATSLLRSLLAEGTPLYLERDVEPRDDYGRLLAYVYRATDGLLLNLELARQGAAIPLTIRPNTAHADEVAGATAEARAAERGLWGACPDPVEGSG